MIHGPFIRIRERSKLKFLWQSRDSKQRTRKSGDAEQRTWPTMHIARHTRRATFATFAIANAETFNRDNRSKARAFLRVHHKFSSANALKPVGKAGEVR